MLLPDLTVLSVKEGTIEFNATIAGAIENLTRNTTMDRAHKEILLSYLHVGIATIYKLKKSKQYNVFVGDRSTSNRLVHVRRTTVKKYLPLQQTNQCKSIW